MNNSCRSRKVALIGTGAVGTSFIYSALNSGLAQEYILIDRVKEFAEGQALDLEDASAYLTTKINSIRAGTYKDLKDVDLIVITAGRPQKDGETRLEMLKDNSLIMKEIALEVKNSGFSGITVIASNPVDIMTLVYQEITKFDSNRVISSGTSLDTARLRVELSKIIGVNSSSIKAYVIGEHGDSSVSTFSHSRIGLVPLLDIIKARKIPISDLDKLHESVWGKAYEIIKRKRATHYGIGVSLNKIAHAVLENELSVVAVGAKLNGEYGAKDIYFGTPCILGNNGIEHVIEVPLSDKEREKAKKSIKVLTDSSKIAIEAIK